MSQPLPPPIDLAHRRQSSKVATDLALGELQAELESLRRVRDGEARRLEARIGELERLLPELWQRGRRITELLDELERERRARGEAEETAEIFSEEIELLRRALDDERERNTRLSGGGDPSAPADPYRVWERRFRERLEARTDDRLQRLREQAARQRVALEEKEARLIELTGILRSLVPAPGPDDLTRISGIGPVIAGILNEHGIRSFAELADADETQLQRVSESLPVYPGRIADDRWVEQARRLADERADDLRWWEGLF
jgi:predicted flap endonuclease-1-like 5' DNA nuclease